MVDKRLVDNLVQEERQRANNLEQKLRDSERENQALRKADFGLRRDRDALRKEVKRVRMVAENRRHADGYSVGFVDGMNDARDQIAVVEARTTAAEAALVEVRPWCEIHNCAMQIMDTVCEKCQEEHNSKMADLNRAEPEKGENK